MTRSRTQRVVTRKFGPEADERVVDEVIVEEPMSIQLDGVLVNTTMRTPGHDFELAAGFCFCEGLLADPPVVRQVRYCAVDRNAAASEYNVVSVDSGGTAPPPVARLGTTSSSCGLCGSEAIDALTARLRPIDHPGFAPEALAALPGVIADQLPLFASTGAVHSAAAFTAELDAVAVREDIGRHNAVDKVVGRLLLDRRLPAHGMVLVVSGRASFEMVQKAWAAGFAALVAVSAPSALAVETARAAGLQLAGFARNGKLNLY